MDLFERLLIWSIRIGIVLMTVLVSWGLAWLAVWIISLIAMNSCNTIIAPDYCLFLQIIVSVAMLAVFWTAMLWGKKK